MTDPDSSPGAIDYRTLANALPQIIWTCDATGQLNWVNDRWSELTGMSWEQTRDKGALAAAHPDDRKQLEDGFAQAVAMATACELGYRIRTVHGDYRYHLCRVEPVRDDYGVITGWVAAAFDIQERHEAEAALRASETRFATVFHLNPQATSLTRLHDGLFLDVNEAFLRLMEVARDDVVGRTALDLGFVTPELRAQMLAGLDQAPVTHHAVQRTTASGRALTLDISFACIDFGGELCLISVATDLTEILAASAGLQQSEALARARADELAALMDAVPAVVLIAHDTECLDLHANRTGRDVLHSDADANLSKSGDGIATHHFRVFDGDTELPPESLPLQRAARGIEVRNHDERIVFDDGQVVHLYGNAVPLLDATGAPRGAIGAFVDVTRLKNAEAALREADQRKDEFIALLSHELRNPLAAIVGAAELMQSHGVSGEREREVIFQQALHLVKLVEDLLDASRIAREKVELDRRPVELADIVARAVELTRPFVALRGHDLIVNVPVSGFVVDADQVRLTQVINNVLVNAARYTPPGGRIDVSASHEDGDVVLRVRDNGVGIDANLMPHLFEMFMQGTNRLEHGGSGLGLGLSLAQSLIALHGGTITARSDGPGQGSEFTIRLSASTRAIDTQARSKRRSRRSAIATTSPKRILVVDDNRDGLEMIEMLLSAAGHDVRVAHDPAGALDVAASFRPQLAILDIGLPSMDGYTLAREMRTRMGNDAPVFIALTGYGSDADRGRSADAGFALHLVKPIDAISLVHSIDRLVTETSPSPLV